VPTGAGESRVLTHDAVSYGGVKFFPDGKRLLATGIEAGHGLRDYLIDLSSGDSKPITPEGIVGISSRRTAGASRCVDPMENEEFAAGRRRVSSHSGARLGLRHHGLDADGDRYMSLPSAGER